MSEERDRGPGSDADHAGATPSGSGESGDVDHPGATSSGPGESGDTDTGEVTWRTYVRDFVSSVVAVLLVGALLFAVSGVWPPLVAIESPSMDPHIKQGDLVFVMEEGRFDGQGARSGVVTAQAGVENGYRTFRGHGDVIVYAPDGNDAATPIIHRAMLWVEDGERWYDRANGSHVGGADSCEEMRNCPAPYAGFITKGDNNNRYDQVGGTTISGPVRPDWVVGTAETRVPALGRIRLQSGEALAGNATAAP